MIDRCGPEDDVGRDPAHAASGSVAGHAAAASSGASGVPNRVAERSRRAPVTPDLTVRSYGLRSA